MPLSTLKDIDVEHRKVLVRADLDVPVADDASIADDRRIRTALLTLRRLMERGAAIVLLAHLGCPRGELERTHSSGSIGWQSGCGTSSIDPWRRSTRSSATERGPP